MGIKSLVLTHGSLLIMGGTTQRHWLHSIPRLLPTDEAQGVRINLTFRVLLDGEDAGRSNSDVTGPRSTIADAHQGEAGALPVSCPAGTSPGRYTRGGRPPRKIQRAASTSSLQGEDNNPDLRHLYVQGHHATSALQPEAAELGAPAAKRRRLAPAPHTLCGAEATTRLTGGPPSPGDSPIGGTHLESRAPPPTVTLDSEDLECDYEVSCFGAMAAGLNRGGQNLNRP